MVLPKKYKKRAGVIKMPTRLLITALHSADATETRYIWSEI